jgi:hypothetical protein
MVEAEETRVGNNSLPDVVKGKLASAHPDIHNWIGILARNSLCPKRCYPELKVVNIFAMNWAKPINLGTSHTILG